MRQVHIVNGVVENAIEAPEGFSYDDGSLVIPSDTAEIGDLYANGAFTKASPSPTYQTTGLTFLQFMGLLKPAEQAALVNSTDTQVRLFNLMAAGAGSIDLANPELVKGVEYCASLGLIPAERVPVILSGAPPG